MDKKSVTPQSQLNKNVFVLNDCENIIAFIETDINNGRGLTGQLFYESTDCTGQGYLDANFLRVNGTVYKLDGEWVRLPLYDYNASNVGITAKSKTDNAQTNTVSNPGLCEETNELVNQAVIPIPYDPEPIRLKLKAPVRVVEP